MLQEIYPYVNHWFLNMEHPTENLDVDFVSAVLQAKSDSLLAEISRVKKHKTEEAIHDARVQSRRMRAALEAFKDFFPPHPWQSVYAAVRSITKTLGTVRENDVLLSRLKELTAAGDMAENLCREYLQEKLQQEGEKLRRKLNKRLRSLQPKLLRQQVAFLLSGSGPGEGVELVLRLPRRKAAARQPSLFPVRETSADRGRHVVAGLSQPVLSFRRADFRAASDTRLHKLRISVKKLRYALEIFRDTRPEFDPAIGLARAFQEAAGRFQDWCVLDEHLRDEIRRLTRQETSHLAFQMGRLLALVQDRKSESRKGILPALLELQSGLPRILEPHPAGLPAARAPVEQEQK
jgi:CHAD domain-containing protein